MTAFSNEDTIISNDEALSISELDLGSVLSKLRHGQEISIEIRYVKHVLQYYGVPLTIYVHFGMNVSGTES